MKHSNDDAPLEHLDDWDDDVRRRYSAESQSSTFVDPEKKEDAFRDYENDVRPGVRDFYRLNHRYQTYEFGQQMRAKYLPLRMRRMGIWEAMEYLNTLVDDSDPDTDLSQIEHLMQTAEAIRADGHPRWFILTGLIHDLGKVLCLYGDPQWAVVGDTFPVGCAFSNRIVFPEFFDENPDRRNSEYSSKLGIYQQGCGLDNVMMSWGHDEYLYHVVKDYLPIEAFYMIRYHSFYAGHREGEYDYLMNDEDRRLFESVRCFNPYDLYTKSHQRPDLEGLKTYYQELITEFFPAELSW